MIELVNYLGTLISEHALKFYTALAAGCVWLGTRIKSYRDAKIKEKDELVSRVTSLEQEVSTINMKMDEDREQRKTTDAKIDRILDAVTDLKIKVAVNQDRLERD